MRLIETGEAGAIRSSSFRFSTGDVLYGRMRPYLNKVWVAEFDGICSAEFLVFPSRDGLRNEFLAARLNADDFVSYANQQVSGERPRADFESYHDFQSGCRRLQSRKELRTNCMPLCIHYKGLSALRRVRVPSFRVTGRLC
jgi:type I restriction enzyme, S subunit